MKKIFVLAALSVIATTSVNAQSSGLKPPVGYPGSNWSVLTFNPSPIKNTPEDDNILLQGRIEQGIDWFRFGDDNRWRFNTFAGLGYSWDKNGLSYNNKLVPGVGMKISRDYESGVLDFGVQVIHQYTFRGVTDGDESGTGVSAYVSYWFGWNLGKK